MKIDAKRIIQDQLVDSTGLNRYCKIMQRVKSVDVSKDIIFQSQYNGFFKVRRNYEWRRIFYELLESLKTQPANFTTIITTLFEKTGSIEAVYSSKMLTTLNPNKPILDNFILQRLGMQLIGKNKYEQLQNSIALYDEIEKWYDEYLCTEDAKECIDVFDRILPEFKWLSNIKKVEFFLNRHN